MASTLLEVGELPPEHELPEPGSDDWLRAVTRRHRQRTLMQSQRGCRCTHRNPKVDPIERWEHVRAATVGA